MMTERKWTPGPWVVEKYCHIADEVVISRSENKHYVTHIDCDDSYCDEYKANAHLIAASPDLYEALEEMAMAVDVPARLADKVDTALAKARGEQ